MRLVGRVLHQAANLQLFLGAQQNWGLGSALSMVLVFAVIPFSFVAATFQFQLAYLQARLL